MEWCLAENRDKNLHLLYFPIVFMVISGLLEKDVKTMEESKSQL
jgi:hypothetical protein